MSETVRFALVAEGPTDRIVIEAALRALLPDHEFALQLLQPESSVAFGPQGTGWAGVYRWCHQAVQEGGGHITGSAVFRHHDVVIVHLDADVAGKTYASANLDDNATDLPCQRPCPPAADTTNSLRRVLLRWLGERRIPPGMVFCTPSKNTETWVLLALKPDHKRAGNECYDNAEGALASLPKTERVKKSSRDYRARRDPLTRGWRAVRQLGEAERFSQDVLGVLGAVRR